MTADYLFFYMWSFFFTQEQISTFNNKGTSIFFHRKFSKLKILVCTIIKSKCIKNCGDDPYPQLKCAFYRKSLEFRIMAGL